MKGYHIMILPFTDKRRFPPLSISTNHSFTYTEFYFVKNGSPNPFFLEKKYWESFLKR